MACRWRRSSARHPRRWPTSAASPPRCCQAHTALIGVRNLDEREKAAVRASGALVFTIKDIDRLGIAVVTERALAHATTGTVGVHVSFDLDVCDPGIAPGVGTPVKGGLDYREAHMLMEMVGRFRPAPRARSGRGEPGPRRPERHRHPGRGARRVGVRNGHSLTVVFIWGGH
jgi:hypothetical protein